MLDVKNLSVTKISHKPLKIVDNVSFSVEKGRTLGIVGESGCGKTTLALSLLKLNPYEAEVSGEIIYKGEDLLKLKDLCKYRGKEIAFIPQNPAEFLNPVMKIGKQLQEVTQNRNESIKLLKKVGIADAQERLDNYPYQLSGGMKQRILIAMALANNPKIIIADEPTSGLDVTIQAQVLKILEDIKSENNLSMIFISHDMGVISKICDDVLVMYSGRLVEMGTVENIFYHSAHPYTKGLINSLKIAGNQNNRFIKIKGSPVDISLISDNCSFANRCYQVSEICFEKKPEVKKISDNHQFTCHAEE